MTPFTPLTRFARFSRFARLTRLIPFSRFARSGRHGEVRRPLVEDVALLPQQGGGFFPVAMTTAFLDGGEMDQIALQSAASQRSIEQRRQRLSGQSRIGDEQFQVQSKRTTPIGIAAPRCRQQNRRIEPGGSQGGGEIQRRAQPV
jgi:hypothetical protein